MAHRSGCAIPKPAVLARLYSICPRAPSSQRALVPARIIYAGADQLTPFVTDETQVDDFIRAAVHIGSARIKVHRM